MAPRGTADHGEAVGGGRGVDAGQRTQRVDRLADRIARGAPAGISSPGSTDLHRQQVGLSKPVSASFSASIVRTSSPAPQSSITVRATWPMTSTCRMRGACVTRRAARAYRRQQRLARDQQGGHEADDDAGRHREAERVEQHATSTVSAGDSQQIGRREGDERVEASVRQQHAEHAAGDGEQQALDEQLPDDRPRPAPSDVRIAISRRRDAARASSRLATLKQAIDSSTPTAP